MIPTFDTIDRAIGSHEDDLVDLRRHLHAHPELSRREHQTTKTLASRLEALGWQVRVRPEGNGLVAELARPGFDPKTQPTAAIRADMDALPIQEENEVPYASQNPGVMHACGHDVHMSCAMAAATALAAVKDELPGRVRLVYQHAEEVAPSGGADMVAWGAIEGVGAIVALHCNPEAPAGTIAIRDGALTAAYDRFELTINGRGGHGARPHHCIDPIYVGTQLAQALYNAPGRSFDAREAMTISIGEFHAGHAPNVIPESARLTGTVRTLSRERRAGVEPMLRRIAQGICATHGATYELELFHGTPPILNHPGLNALFAHHGAQVLGGPEHIVVLEHPSMGSEDFAHYLGHIPGAMFRLGTAKQGRPVHLLHTPRFDVDERAIALGGRILARTAVSMLEKLQADPEAFGQGS